MNFSGTWEGKFDWDGTEWEPSRFGMVLHQNVFGRIDGEALDLDPEGGFPRTTLRGIAQKNVLTFRKTYDRVVFRAGDRRMTLEEYVATKFSDEIAAAPRERVIDYRGVYTADDDALAGRWTSQPDWVQLERSEEWMPIPSSSGLWIAHRIANEPMNLGMLR